MGQQLAAGLCQSRLCNDGVHLPGGCISQEGADRQGCSRLPESEVVLGESSGLGHVQASGKTLMLSFFSDVD